MRMLLACIVFLLTGGLFVYTAAPTVSFWDCGEFVATAFIQGIPHPPGTPFFMIIGRFFILAFQSFGEVAYRLNLMSALTSATACSFTFLFTDRLLVMGFKKPSSDFISYISGFIAAALVGLSDTFWFNAVEAEVYGITLMVLMILAWVSLLWAEHHKTPLGDRLLVLLVYLCFLGVGLHLTTMVTLPVLFLFVIMIDKDLRTSLPVWLSGILLFSLVYAAGSFIIFALISLAISIIGFFAIKDGLWKRGFNLAMWFSVVAILGFSTHLYIPIRSAQNPQIDENDPQTWDRFKGFIERKQYGSESMIERAFYRRSELGNQLFTHPNMGYGGYMLAQYLPWKVGAGQSVLEKQEYKGPWTFQLDVDGNEPIERWGLKFPTQVSFMPPHTGRSKQALFFILFHIPMLFGVWQLYKKNRPFGTYAFLLYFIGSFAMIFYINFSDGLRPEFSVFKQWKAAGMDPQMFPGTVHMEVRERDYFYAVGYVFMGILFALSAAVLLEKIKQFSQNKLVPQISGVLLLFFAIAVPAFSNFPEHNRRGNFVPYDYARNLLESCRPNSILFTNGDNDTFPLWFLQEVEGIRKDVRVVNLSLGNTDWYISQMLTLEPKLKLGFSLEEIARLEPTGNDLVAPRDLPLGNTGLTVTLQPRDKQPYYRVQDILVINLVQNNYPERPIHFAVTVSNSNFMGLEKYTIMEGMVYTLTNQIHNQNIDVQRTAYLVDSVYQYRGLGNTGSFLNSDTKGMLSNYFATNHRLAYWAQDEITRLRAQRAQLAAQGEGAAALLKAVDDTLAQRLAFGHHYLEKTEQIMPWDWRHFYYASNYYRTVGDKEKAIASLEKGLALGKRTGEFSAMLGGLYLESQQIPKAKELFVKAYQANPKDIQMVYTLASMYERLGEFQTGVQVLTDWLTKNPGHPNEGQLRQYLSSLQAQIPNQPQSILSAPLAPAQQAPVTQQP